jgi:integrase
MWSHYRIVIPAYFQFAFATGLRPSEAIALQWGDIDWNRRTVTVSRAYVRHQDKGTKTHNVRDVDLNDMAIAALTAMKPHTFMKGPNSPVFCSPEGKPWLSERRQREDFFHPALRACGIRLRKAYNTRHTFATINLMAGVNPAYIASQLGHADTTMLFKHYAKWIRGADSGTEAAKSRAAFGAAPSGEMAPNWPRENVKPITSRG